MPCNVLLGALQLCLVREGVSRGGAVSVFLDIEEGKHLSNPQFEIVPVAALRLEVGGGGWRWSESVAGTRIG